MFAEMNINAFLDELASNSPAPGGGTVAGLTGALSSALVSMVCNLTIGKKRYRQHEGEIKNVLEKTETLRKEFVLLAEKDTEVFNEVMKAYSLPHESEEEKAVRKQAVEEATKRAALVPMDVLRRCESVVRLAMVVAQKGNENSISDAGVAAIMAFAAAQAASLNILINLSTVSDEDFIGKLKTEQNRVLKEIKGVYEETLQLVNSKL